MSDEARAAALLAANLHEADLEHNDDCDDFKCTCHPWRVAGNALLKIIEWQASRPVTDAITFVGGTFQCHRHGVAQEPCSCWPLPQSPPVTDDEVETPRQDVVLAAIEAYEQVESIASTHGGKPYAMMVAALKAAARKVREGKANG